jgi:hypothetical protein
MFMERYHNLFYDDKDNSAIQKQMFDLKRLDNDLRESVKLLKAHKNPFNNPNAKIDSIDYQMISLQNHCNFQKRGRDSSKGAIHPAELSRNEKNEISRNKKREIANLFTNGMMALEKPKSLPRNMTQNILAWAEPTEDRPTPYFPGRLSQNGSNVVCHYQSSVPLKPPNLQMHRAHLQSLKENQTEVDSLQTNSNLHYNFSTVIASPFAPININSQLSNSQANSTYKKFKLTESQVPLTEDSTTKVTDLRGKTIKMSSHRERNVITGEHFQDLRDTLKQSGKKVVNQGDNASRLIYQTGQDDQKNIQRNLIDEFIDQNYGSIHIGKKGILAYEEEKKVQSECQKILNPYHLKQLMSQQKANPVKVEIAKVALKNRITAKTSQTRKDKLAKILNDVANY